ncbi:S8 family serine peptidase [Catenovulum sp. SM1970]|uniref:S8 family peptidase n=1 Tax=Marinifaba aquimaris TaxID=2741323 RepID=UPI00157461C9|nr:S8 family peptidase [Marinifaba aquimaris]NTS75575.1 S8 family serine peptidase [Marinifaba aquimaris]
MKVQFNKLTLAMLGLGLSSMALASDPLYPQQWHLHNTGQDGFSASSGTPGQDLNTQLTQAFGIAGVGVKVAVIDTGVQIDHPDLAQNVVTGSLNFMEDTGYPADYPFDYHGHGTSVAGLIAAVGNNNEGVRGVASSASLVGYNYLGAQSMEAWLASHGATKESADVRVFNQSYGFSPIDPITYLPETDPELALIEQVTADVSANAQYGRGAVFVKSAGNGYRYFNTGNFFVLPGDFFAGGNNLGLPMHNSNQSYDNVNYFNFVTSATDANGQRTSYSSVGSNVWVSAPGGEYGRDFPAMVTTDLMGCEDGSNTSAGLGENQLHGGTEYDPSCDYTSTMNGTSSAAPNTSGVIAAVMSTNHALSARDVRALVVDTARKTDNDHPGVALDFVNAQGETVSYQAIDAWQENAAGYAFHAYYGFGTPDLDAAMSKARMTNSVLPQLQTTEWQNVTADVAIPDASLAGGESVMKVESNLTVEQVQVRLTLDHARLPDLAIELISPAGTRSVLLTPRNGLVGQALNPEITGFDSQIMASNQFYGENAKGDWTLRAVDTNGEEVFSFIAYINRDNIFQIPLNNNAEDGVIKSWDMRIFGH